MPRLGVIIPSSNTTVETEFSNVLFGSQISLHTDRVSLREVTVEGLLDMEHEVEAAAGRLGDAAVDAVAFACTSGSLIKGVGHDAAIAQKIAAVARCPVVVTSGAVVQALKTLNAHKISLATPYISEVTHKEVEFLEQSGFEVVKQYSLGLRENLQIGKLTAQNAKEAAQKADVTASEAVFVSCTNFRTFEAIPALEAKLQKPVVTSNSATLWGAINVLGVPFKLGLGCLFEV
ncbi:MAG: aspartate/glutamate racemase family protein [Candidatus Bathyarchaeota archaeon]|nr:aspartate/glutamate racemase family protein [Candidatus Bathyarchaeota archaeon]